MKIRKIAFVLSVVLVLALMLSMIVGCLDKKDNNNEQPSGGNTPSTSNAITVTDMFNRQHTIDTNAINRVVCVGAGALRLYTYVGDMSKIVAVEEIESKASMSAKFVSKRPYQVAYNDQFVSLINAHKTVGAGGPQAQSLAIDAIWEQEPDIVFSCLSLSADDLATAEQQLGCPIISLKYGAAKAFSQEMIDSIQLIGRIMNAEAKATTLTNYMSSLKTDLASKTQQNGKSVFLACNSNWGTKGFLSTSKSYPLFTISGITNVMDNDSITLTKETNGQAMFADMESVITSDPDVILLDAGGLETFKGDYNKDGSLLPGQLAGLDAWTNKEVYLMMPNNAYDANVEMYFINAYYALTVAYPTVYGVNGTNPINIETKATEILNAFFGANKIAYNDILLYGGYQKLNLPDTWPTL